MEKRYDRELSVEIDNLFGENLKTVSPRTVVEAALEEYDLTEEEFNSVMSFAELLKFLQEVSPAPAPHAAAVGMATGLLIGKVLSERKGVPVIKGGGK